MKFLIRQSHRIPAIGGVSPPPKIARRWRFINRPVTLSRVIFLLSAFAIIPTAAQAQTKPRAKGGFFPATLKNPKNGKTCTTKAFYDTGNDPYSAAGTTSIDWDCAVALGLGSIMNGHFVPVTNGPYTIISGMSSYGREYCFTVQAGFSMSGPDNKGHRCSTPVKVCVQANDNGLSHQTLAGSDFINGVHGVGFGGGLLIRLKWPVPFPKDLPAVQTAPTMDTKTGATVQTVHIGLTSASASVTKNFVVHLGMSYTFLPQSVANSLGLVTTGTVDLSVDDPQTLILLTNDGYDTSGQTVFPVASLAGFDTHMGPSQSGTILIMPDSFSDFGIMGADYFQDYVYYSNYYGTAIGGIDELIYQPGATDASFPVTLEGPVSQAANLSVEVRSLDGSGQKADYFIATDTDGYLGLPLLSPGRYNVWIKGLKWLAQVVSVDATTGTVGSLKAYLPGGDANNDNSVDSTDFGLLIGAYGDTYDITDPNANRNDIAVDFNGDGSIDSTDFGILIGNFNNSGAR